MKKFLALSLILMLGLVIAACGEREQPDMQMMWFSDGIEGEVMEDMLERYREETGVWIELFEIGWDDYETRLGTMVDGDDAPDLIRTTEGVMNNFKEHFVSLDGVYDEAGFTNIFYNDDNEPIGLPMDVTANGLYVNLELLDAHEVEYPVHDGENWIFNGEERVWTWTEFVTEMEKLVGAEGVTYPGTYDPQGHRFMPMIYQQGIKIWDEPFVSTNLTSDEAVAALTLLQDFYHGDLVDDAPIANWNPGGAPSNFETGMYGFHMSGNWFASDYATLDFDWTVAPMPTGETGVRATLLGGKSMSAMQGENVDMALDFITWLAEPANHDEFNNGVPFLSGRIGAEIDFGELEGPYQVFQDEINATPAEYAADWLQMTQVVGIYPIINDMVQDVADPNGLTPLEALEKVEQAIMDSLEDN